MTKKTLAPDDLAVLMRRGALSAAQQRRLWVYLQASPVSRVLYELGQHYDRVPRSRPEDDRMLDRAIAAACERRARSPRRRGLGRRASVAVVTLLCGGSIAVAAAAVVHYVERHRSAPVSDPRPVKCLPT